MIASTLRFLWPRLQPYKMVFLGAILLRLASDIAFLSYPYIIGLLTTEVSKGAALDFPTVYFYFACIAAVIVFIHTTRHLGKGVVLNIGDKVVVSERLRGLQEVLKQTLGWHERLHSEEKISTVARASYAFRDILGMIESVLVQTFVIITGGIVLVTTIDWRFGILFLAYAAVSFVALRRDRKKIQKEVRGMQEAENTLHSLQYELVHHVHTVYALGLHKTSAHKQESGGTNILKHALQRNFLARRQWWTQAMIWLFFLLIMLWIVVTRIQAETMQIGMLASMLLYFRMVEGIISEFVNALQTMTISQVALVKYKQLLEERAIPRELGFIPYDQAWNALSVQSLHAQYEEHEVIHGIDFTVQRGEKVGLVGVSGSGKSTLLSLLAGLRKPGKGSITLDEIPLNDIIDEQLRPFLGIALQDTEVLHVSFRENLTLAAPLATEDEVDVLLQQEWLAPIIAKLPQGADTLVGEKGIRLSGGERQRLGIARAILRQPHLLLLDEATSHLDSVTEAEVQKAIDALRGVTVIAVAHRLSTLRNFDRILVMEQGKIVEEGTWDALMAKNGVFATLKMQQEKEEVTLEE